MVAHYEQLREGVLSRVASRSTGPGLGKGMIAWMRAWTPCMPKAGADVVSPSVATSPCPQDIRAQLAVLLAGLILGRQLEVST